MLIYLTEHDLGSPHRQNTKEKTYIVLKGSMELSFFNKELKLLKRNKMKCEEDNILSFDPSVYHSLKSTSKSVLYLEIIAGPMDRLKTSYL